MELEEDLPDVPLHDEASDLGFTTAELLANAALAIGALVAIWFLLNQLGVDFVGWLREKMQM